MTTRNNEHVSGKRGFRAPFALRCVISGAKDRRFEVQETQELSQKQKAIVEVQKRLDCMAQGLWGSDEDRERV